jgi:hypothetical protein
MGWEWIAPTASAAAATGAMINIVTTVHVARANRRHAAELARIAHQSSYLLEIAKQRGDAYVNALEFASEATRGAQRYQALLTNGQANVPVPAPGENASRVYAELQAYGSADVMRAYNQWRDRMVYFSDRAQGLRRAPGGTADAAASLADLDEAVAELMGADTELGLVVNDELARGAPTVEDRAALVRAE